MRFRGLTASFCVASVLSTFVVGCGSPDEGTLDPGPKANAPGGEAGGTGGEAPKAKSKAKSKAKDDPSNLKMPGAKGDPTLQ